MSKVTVRGRTIEEAVKTALNQLNTTEDSVNVHVIEEPKKGFFGLGAKEAVVEVERKNSDVKEPNSAEYTVEVDNASVVTDEDTVKAESPKPSRDTQPLLKEDEQDAHREKEIADAVEHARQFLKNVLDKMGLPAVQIHIRKEEDFWIFDVAGQDLGMMIGRRGQTLDSLQYLTSVVANRRTKSYVRILIDAENYRARRKETLEQLADRIAKKVIRTRTKLALEPMNAAERKIIHTHLQNYAAVATESDGQEPNRHIVIHPK